MNATGLRTSLTAIAILLATGVGSADDRPNLVVVIADDVGWNDVGYHGSEIETPNLDRLSRSGVRLERFYVQPLCTPTRACLMTGRYPIRYGLNVYVLNPWDDGLSLNERLLPEALREVGYRTALCGKWHLGHRPGYRPHERGFDHAYGCYQAWVNYWTHGIAIRHDWFRNGEPVHEPGYATYLTYREAIHVIEDHDEDQPLFLNVAFNAAHFPLQAPAWYREKYEGIEDPDRREFAAMVTCMDHSIGSIVKALRRKGMWRNTIFFFASDNGGMPRFAGNNAPLRGGKMTPYEGGVRVPAFVTAPRRLPPKRISNETIHIVDWFPTLLRLAGASPGAAPLDGVDVWDVIKGDAKSPREETLLHLDASTGALLHGRWKLIVHGLDLGCFASVELYDVIEDAEESTNVADRHPEIVDRLSAKMERYAKAKAEPETRLAPVFRAITGVHGWLDSPFWDD